MTTKDFQTWKPGIAEFDGDMPLTDAKKNVIRKYIKKDMKSGKPQDKSRKGKDAIKKR